MSVQPTEVSHSPPPSPPPALGPGFRSIAYAQRAPTHGSPKFYKLGSGVENIHEGDHLGLGWLGGWVRDVIARVKEMFRGRPDPFADLHSRGPIAVKVDVRHTITAVERAK